MSAREVRDELVRRLREATVDTPYEVTEVEDGLDLGLALADARWRTVLGKARLERTFAHEVRLHDESTYTITEVGRQVEWVAGAPGIVGSASTFRGRSIEIGAEKTWGLDESGRPIPVADYSFTSEEGRQLIVLAADQLGLSRRLGASERVGLVFAVGTVGLLLLAGVVLLVLWALGVL